MNMWSSIGHPDILAAFLASPEVARSRSVVLAPDAGLATRRPLRTARPDALDKAREAL